MKSKEIHSDERRTITLVEDLLPDNKEFTFIELNKNKAVGGCVHQTEEFFCVISGIILVKIGDEIRLLEAGDSGCIKAGSPHMFHAKEDSILCEWGVTAEDNGTHDKEMRDEVNRINDTSM